MKNYLMEDLMSDEMDSASISDEFFFKPYLKNYLDDKNIHSESAFVNIINNANEFDFSPFKYKTKKDLRMIKPVTDQNGKKELIFFEENESRYFGSNIILRNSIINCEEIKFLNCEEVRLVNCIINGDVILGDNEPGKTKTIYIDNCIILGDLFVIGCKSLKSLTIYKTNLKTFSCQSNQIDDIRITSCRIFEVNIHANIANEFGTLINEFEYVNIYDNRFNSVDFDYKQYPINELNTQLKRKRNVAQFNLFQLSQKNSKDITKSLMNRDIIGTLDFLDKYTDISTNKFYFNKMQYFKSIFYQPNLTSKIIMQILGGFIKPGRIILIASCIYILFSIIYTLPFMTFNEEKTKGLDFLSALYFSGLTYTTIGYGDIIPVGLTRLVAVIEGFLGVITLSAFVVTLVRKYIE